MKAFWTMDETGVIYFIHAQAARPCGKGVPDKFIRQIRIVWNKLGLPPIVTTASASVAASLKKELSASNPRVGKKAITLPLLLVTAMELAIADGDLMGEDRAVIGAELVKGVHVGTLRRHLPLGLERTQTPGDLLGRRGGLQADQEDWSWLCY